MIDGEDETTETKDEETTEEASDEEAAEQSFRVRLMLTD